mmetsp:Transcript_10867/g.28923  ORF Transcript_10867/g.28923 Transcript_10867/m.28923 type:complete len:284 (-) Transcript_10867:589-1440(-)
MPLAANATIARCLKLGRALFRDTGENMRRRNRRAQMTTVGGRCIHSTLNLRPPSHCPGRWPSQACSWQAGAAMRKWHRKPGRRGMAVHPHPVLANQVSDQQKNIGSIELWTPLKCRCRGEEDGGTDHHAWGNPVTHNTKSPPVESVGHIDNLNSLPSGVAEGLLRLLVSIVSIGLTQSPESLISCIMAKQVYLRIMLNNFFKLSTSFSDNLASASAEIVSAMCPSSRYDLVLVAVDRAPYFRKKTASSSSITMGRTCVGDFGHDSDCLTFSFSLLPCCRSGWS